jgi:hypothetical protein
LDSPVNHRFTGLIPIVRRRDTGPGDNYVMSTTTHHRSLTAVVADMRQRGPRLPAQEIALNKNAPTRTKTNVTGLTRIPACGCGQDLDVGGGRHCPRCGTALHTQSHLTPIS